MCGRFVTYSPFEEIIQTFGIELVLIDEYMPSYNIAPSNEVLVVFEKEEKVVLDKFRWGLVPSWSKDTNIGYKMINARAETLTDKKSFKHLVNSKRCGIVANGFYEWRIEGHSKIPYFIKLKDGRLFCFAGLYDTWQIDNNNELYTCTIITTDANEKISQIHDRMPVMLEKEEVEKWIDTKNSFDNLKRLLRAKDDDEIELYQVSNKVNSPKNNSKSNLIPEVKNTLF
ncbi:hypothetical protein PW5551_10080 [Petrotoga sp. 9PW.55.5.1]|uniref:SOS response-associated peptidase n=1 Tax=Petrotoga sp. 9PW.55.5.1 TaxID=1308979 RepID=UPI000DC57FCE|nr:hypothetical protein PW5551_10080 [Petrotoga sp. 9PW.55.5.1]